ncbi:hypothetical protein GH714_001933 [Hevea brasiliensis]|uniref:Uncharacterized protein n=1 Tax=Hevea brasiliensis TaxID=3981 RepID=A0A6A6LYK6_HEVBR|nr:hypothetical protein GH714_001933 [Hevea brasiliensis]
MVKYATIARRDAEIFMKFARAGYKEKIWDHAASVIVTQEVGGVVTDARGRPLDFSKSMYLEESLSTATRPEPNSSNGKPTNPRNKADGSGNDAGIGGFFGPGSGFGIPGLGKGRGMGLWVAGMELGLEVQMEGIQKNREWFGKAHAIGEQHLQPIKPTVFNNKNDHAKGVGMARSKNGFGKSRVIIEQQLQPIKPRVFTNKNGGANGVGRVRPRNGFGKGCFIGKQQQHRSIQSNKLTILTHNSGVVIGKDDHPMHVRPSVVMHNYHAAESGLNRLFGSDSGNTKEGRNGVVGERHLTDHVQPTSGNDFELNKFFGPGSKFGKRWGKGGVAGDRYRGKPEQQQSEMSSVRRKTRQADPSVSPPDGVGK